MMQREGEARTDQEGVLQESEDNDKNARDDSEFVEGGQDFEEEDMEEQEKQDLWEREEYLAREGLEGKSAVEVVTWLHDNIQANIPAGFQIGGSIWVLK